MFGFTTGATKCKTVHSSSDFYDNAAPSANVQGAQKIASAPRPPLTAAATTTALKEFAESPETSSFYTYTEMKDGAKRMQFKHEEVRPDNPMYGRRAPILQTPPMVVHSIAGRPGIGDDTKDKPCYTLSVSPIPIPPASITGELRDQLICAREKGIAFLSAMSAAESRIAKQMGWTEFYNNCREGSVSMKMDLQTNSKENPETTVFAVIDNRPNGTHEELDYKQWAEAWVVPGDIVTVNFEFSFTYHKGANKGIRLTFFEIVKQLDPLPEEAFKRTYERAFSTAVVVDEPELKK